MSLRKRIYKNQEHSYLSIQDLHMVQNLEINGHFEQCRKQERYFQFHDLISHSYHAAAKFYTSYD